MKTGTNYTKKEEIIYHTLPMGEETMMKRC
jgi:hypothetical protein